MTFKDALLTDIENVFLNEDEFAEPHDIMDRSVLCLVDDQESQATTASKGDFSNASGLGLLNCDRVVYCKAEDLERIPRAQERICMDQSYWLVGDGIQNNMGLLTIPLNRAY